MVKHVLGDVEDEGKGLNTRNNNAAGDKTGMEWKQARSHTSRALEIQDSSKRGFRASEQTCAGDKRVPEWNSGCLSSPFRFQGIYTYTYTYIRVDYSNGTAN